MARIGTNQLLTDSPELIFRMNAARSPYTKSKWYNGSRIQPGRDNIFSGVDEDRHTKRRAQMASGVSEKLFLVLLPFVNRCLSFVLLC